VQAVQGGFGLVLFDRFAHVLRHCLEIALVGRGREGIQLGHWRVVQHAGGDLPAVISEVGQSRFIAQAVFGLAVLEQCLDDFADQVITFDRPEAAQTVGLRGPAFAVDYCIDVAARVLFKEPV
jgi:hypothetical protein